MTITLEMREDVAVFRYPAGYDELVDEFDDLLERRDTGRLGNDRYVAALEDLVARHPWFIDGFTHLGNAFFDRGQYERALEAYERAYSLGTAPLPEGFEEFIEWKYLENRPFLRAAHGLALCRSQLGRSGEAISLLAKILAWNPDDNQGVRYVIGSEYLRAGQEDRARPFFETEAAYYPPYRYELALLLLRHDRHVEAATNLRLGFNSNGYIAEVLCGNPHPLPTGIWHGSSWSQPALAMEYALHYGKLWQVTPDAVAFLRWLHTHPKVMVERAAILECREALLWEPDTERRRSIMDAEVAAWDRIDDRLSSELVIERTSRDGDRVYPWLYAGTLDDL